LVDKYVPITIKKPNINKTTQIILEALVGKPNFTSLISRLYIPTMIAKSAVEKEATKKRELNPSMWDVFSYILKRGKLKRPSHIKRALRLPRTANGSVTKNSGTTRKKASSVLRNISEIVYS
jgi:hypothetical protein